MKKTGKVFVSIVSLGMLLNNIAYATTEIVEEQSSGSSAKYIFMGVAALVIVLLLYLGYKMDTKGNEPVSKISNKAKKTKEKLSEKAEEIKQNSEVYEEDDDITYQEDEDFDNEELNDAVEYNEDEDEDSLFSMSNEENDNVVANEEIPQASNNEPVNPPEPTPVAPVENYEEEFDTSIIDGLDEDTNESEPQNNNFEDTMIFENAEFSPEEKKLEEEIDGLDNIEDVNLNEDTDSFIDELKNFQEPENNFEGFSIVNDNEEDDNVQEEKKAKKYTKVKKESEDNFGESFSDNDFLSQMEANLKKSKEERDSKKVSKTTTKKSTKKKEEE